MTESETTIAVELPEKVLPEDIRRLIELWDEYGREGYENIYLVRITKDHREKLGKLFLPSEGGTYVDVGCGTGNTFELIVQNIRPKEVHAIDWSAEMLKKAKMEAKRLQPISETHFKFHFGDIAKSLPWPNDYFDGAVSNLVICYLRCGWQKSVKELNRVIKPGGYLYIGTLLDTWSFTSVLWKHAPIEFLREPITSLRGLKYRRIVARISKELQKHGAEFPSRPELINFLKMLGLEEIEVVPTYWGGGLALRAKVS